MATNFQLTGPGNIETVSATMPSIGELFRIQGKPRLYYLAPNKGVAGTNGTPAKDEKAVLYTIPEQDQNQVISALGNPQIKDVNGADFNNTRPEGYLANIGVKIQGNQNAGEGYAAIYNLPGSTFLSAFPDAKTFGGQTVTRSPNTSSEFYNPANPGQPNYASVPGYGSNTAVNQSGDGQVQAQSQNGQVVEGSQINPQQPFALFVQKKGDPTVYGVTQNGEFVAFQTPDQFFSAGGAQDFSNVQTRDDLKIPDNVQNYTQYAQKTAGGTNTAPFDPTAAGVDPALYNQLSPSEKALVESLYNMGQQQIKAGQANLAINNETMNKALQLAQSDPAILAKYGDAAITNKADLINSLGTLNTDFAQNYGLQTAQQLEERKQLANEKAAAGIAYSGYRNQAQQLQEQGHEAVLSSSKRQLDERVRGLGSSYEKLYGSAALASLGTPIAAGGSTYQPYGNVQGSIPFQQKADVENKQEDLYKTLSNPIMT